jgi:hypothetical protein
MAPAPRKKDSELQSVQEGLASLDAAFELKYDEPARRRRSSFDLSGRHSALGYLSPFGYGGKHGGLGKPAPVHKTACTFSGPEQ